MIFIWSRAHPARKPRGEEAAPGKKAARGAARGAAKGRSAARKRPAAAAARKRPGVRGTGAAAARGRESRVWLSRPRGQSSWWRGLGLDWPDFILGKGWASWPDGRGGQGTESVDRVPGGEIGGHADPANQPDFELSKTFIQCFH